MAQPGNYGITEEITLLKETASRFYQDNYTDQTLHKLVASDCEDFDKPRCNWEKSHWQQMVELGWTMVAVPEEEGGMGMSLVAATLLVEETGRAGCPSPLVETFKSTYLLNACLKGGAADNAKKILSEIIEGKAVGLAISGSDGLFNPQENNPQQCDVQVKDGGLEGNAYFVQDALKVDTFIVKTNAGLYKVAADAKGLVIKPDVIADLTRDQAHIRFDGVVVGDADLLANEADAAKAINDSASAIYTLIAADMVGSSEWLLQTTSEYARTRVQFDRPIGFFQAVKHPLVNMMMAIDEAKSLVYNAACAYDHEPEMLQQYAHMAKASACNAAAFSTATSIQLHGGIGITWECFVHVFAKRVKHNEFLYGDANFHQARLMELLVD